VSDAADSDGVAILSARRMAWMRFRSNPIAVIGALMVLSVLVCVAFAPWIAPYPDHAGNVVDFANRHEGPKAGNPAGTDKVGRDILSRVIFGFRVSLMLVVGVLGVAVPVGAALGLAAG